MTGKNGRANRIGNYWPTDEQVLLLRAGLLHGDEAIAAWDRVRRALDPGKLGYASQRLLPLVYANLVRHRISDPTARELRSVYCSTWASNQRLFGRLVEVIDVLSHAGIPAIALKGMALVVACYRDIGARPMGDIDVLVPTAEAVRAGQVLCRAGWSPRYAFTPAFVSVKHAAPFENAEGEECDLHWHVLEESVGTDDDSDIWAHSRTAEFQGVEIRIQSPADQLVHVCAHGARWAPTPGIRWVADAALLVQAGGVDWHRLVAQASVRRAVVRLRETLCYLGTVMGAAIPRDALAELSNLPVSVLERFEHRVRSREHRLLGELVAYWCHYLRRRRGDTIPFPRYLQRAWGLESLSCVPSRALSLAARRVRASLKIRVGV